MAVLALCNVLTLSLFSFSVRVCVCTDPNSLMRVYNLSCPRFDPNRTHSTSLKIVASHVLPIEGTPYNHPSVYVIKLRIHPNFL
jgi:hypothetical protein